MTLLAYLTTELYPYGHLNVPLAYALSVEDCLKPSVNPQWNLGCKQGQNWGSGDPEGDRVSIYYYDSVAPLNYKYTVDVKSFATIHVDFGNYPDDQLAYYPVREAGEAAANWDDSSSVSALSVSAGGGNLSIVGIPGGLFNTRAATDAVADTATGITFDKSACGDGALAACFFTAVIRFNGSWGWLPSHDAPATFCCGRFSIGPPGLAPESAGIMGFDETFMHEFGHAIGMQHIPGFAECPPGDTSRVHVGLMEGDVQTCDMRDPSSSDIVAMRFFYGKP